jgi:hypothetical protein
VQQTAAMAGLTNVVSPDNIYNAGVEMAEAMQLPLPERFFTDPQGKPPPEPTPDGSDQVKIMETKRRSDDNQKQLELDANKLQVDMAGQKAMAEFRVMEHQDKMELEREQMASSERIALAQIKANEKLAAKREKEAKKNGNNSGSQGSSNGASK